MLKNNAPSDDQTAETSIADVTECLSRGENRESHEPQLKRSGSLVLTRRLDEAIVIADVVEVRVVDIKPNAIRLKITAPRSIAVHRREVYEAIRSTPWPTHGTRPEATGRSTSGTGTGSLVLTRHAGEEIMIGDDVKIEVGEIRSQTLRLRITAPRQISVHRWEIHEAIRRDEAKRTQCY